MAPTTLEVTWTLLTAILFVGLNLMGSKVWASERWDAAPPGSTQVEVTSMQFAWYFRYPGPDGKYGATSPKLMDPSSGGEAAVGLDTSDPAAKDDVVTSTMYLPVNREVDISLRSVDVIHSFFVPSLRFKQDAVPGLNIHMHFKPTAIGEYEIACAELCGLGHYKMHGMVHVVSQEDFDKWLAENHYPVSSHAGIPDTAEMLYLGGDKGWVRKELVATAVGDPVRPRGTPRDPNEKRINNGISGDALSTSSPRTRPFAPTAAAAPDCSPTCAACKAHTATTAAT